MTTRATYSFCSLYSPEITVFNKYDGYFSGAANLLYNADTGRIVKTVEEFIRINPQSFITGSHEDHDDTEYRYYIDWQPPHEPQIIALRRVDFTTKWEIAYSDDLAKFVYEQRREEV